MKKRIFNKRGMTYVEMLVALALLALIIVSFTPMLLSSYEALYAAGEKTEEVYESKQQLEEGLAVRNSTKIGNVQMTFKMNAEELFVNMNVNGRKIVSSLRESLETIFYGVRARIDFLTTDVVYDDTSSHEVILQTTGLDYNSVTYIKKYTGSLEDLKQDEIVFGVYIPNKATGSNGSTTDELVYEDPDDRFDTASIDFNAVKGRIKFRIDNVDFTLSPVKILVYYKNERNILKTLSTYLTIKPATIMMAGTTTGNDYYTSAGIEEKNASTDGVTQKTQYSLAVQGRTMRTENSPYLTKYLGSPTQLRTSGFPSANTATTGKTTNIIIRNITWVQNDETEGVDPYYVMVGTNGVIYRMYNFTSHNTDVFKLSTGQTSKPNTDGYSTTDGLTPVDNVFDAEDGRRVYSSLWSGDSAHVFDFSTFEEATNYGVDENGNTDNCWLTAEQETVKEGTSFIGIKLTGDTNVNTNKGADKYNLFGMQAKFSYYYDGARLGYEYNYQGARNISYILTEYGAPFRLFGFLKEEKNFQNFTEIWYQTTGDYETGRISWVKSKNDEETDVNCIPVFDGSPAYRHIETSFASLRFQHLGSYDPNIADGVNFMRTDGTATDNRENARQITDGREYLGGLESEINLTAATYIPAAKDGAKGTMLYLGTTSAYMNVMQNDNLSTTENYSKNVKNTWDDVPDGARTDYIIFGTADGTGTTVHKYSSPNLGWNNYKFKLFAAEKDMWTWSFEAASASDKQAKMAITSTNKMADDTRRNFFVARQTSWKDMYMDDVLFTMGYSSNREKVYTNVTYNGVSDLYRSYEHYYFLSHYGVGGVNDDGTPIKTATRATVGSDVNRNIANNDYYNVWFPGEMYNLTKVAHKDGVTVAVGYTVAGSTYQWINPGQKTNTSTALGGIYNDGVLAAMVEGTQSEFTNLLYFKDNNTMDTDFLTGTYSGTSYYDEAFGTYGTHDRQSVQFTAVDLNTESSAVSNNSQNISYYAYYGDSHGRLFKSLVATATATLTSEDKEDVTTTQNINLVSFISDTSYAGTVTAPSTMQEIKVGDSISLSEYFTEIVTIDANEDIVIVSGTAKTSSTSPAVVVGTKDTSGNWTWKKVQLTNKTNAHIYATKLIGGYYYFAGNGFFAGVSLDALKSASNGAVIGAVDNKADNNGSVIWTTVADTIYAMDGRETF